jgi:DNA-binding response OmpR family regulator
VEATLGQEAGKWLGKLHTASNECPICGGPRNFNAPLTFYEGRVYWEGAHLPLSPQETLILQTLVKRHGQVVEKETMFAMLYNDLPDCDWPELAILNVHMVRIRKRLVAAAIPLLIETIWGRGWLLREKLNADGV